MQPYAEFRKQTQASTGTTGYANLANPYASIATDAWGQTRSMSTSSTPTVKQNNTTTKGLTKMQSYSEYIQTKGLDKKAEWYNDIQNWAKENPNLAAGGTAALATIPLYLLGRGFGKKRDRTLGLITALLGGGAAFYGMKTLGLPWLTSLGQAPAAPKTQTAQIVQSGSKSGEQRGAPPVSEELQDKANEGRRNRGQQQALVTKGYENGKLVYRGLEPARTSSLPWWLTLGSTRKAMNEENSKPFSVELQEIANERRVARGQKPAPITTGYQNGQPIYKK